MGHVKFTSGKASSGGMVLVVGSPMTHSQRLPDGRKRAFRTPVQTWQAWAASQVWGLSPAAGRGAKDGPARLSGPKWVVKEPPEPLSPGLEGKRQTKGQRHSWAAARTKRGLTQPPRPRRPAGRGQSAGRRRRRGCGAGRWRGAGREPGH